MDSAYAAAYPDLYRRHWWWRAREAILLRQIAALTQGRRPPLRILDVGCGAGLFFDALQSFGHVEGIESDGSAVARAGKWRSRIHVGNLDASFKPAAPYDVILMLDVLEHVPRPGDVLRQSRAVLEPDGFVLVTVPAFNWLWTRHDELNHHVRRYTAAEMQEVVADAGLAPVHAKYFFQSLIVPKLVVRLREFLFSPAPSVPTIPASAINATLRRWCLAEYTVARWVPFGTSLMVVARPVRAPAGR